MHPAKLILWQQTNDLLKVLQCKDGLIFSNNFAIVP